MSRRDPSRLVLAIALFVAGPPTAASARAEAGGATAAPDSLQAPYRLEEVVVYGETPAGPGMITNLRGAELLDRGGGDVAHLLRLDPGLAVSAGGKAETETRLRGMPARATLILVDGRPVNPGYYGKVDLTMFSSSGLAAVQVVKGPASAAYGPNAMGGVVNIITRSGFDAPGTAFSTRLGEDGLRRLSLSHAQRRGSLAISVHGYEQHSDGFRLSGDFSPTSVEDGGLRANSGYRKAGGGVKAGFERGDRDIYTVTFDYHWSRRQIPATIYAWESPTWRDFPVWKRYGASLNNQRRFGPGLELVTVLYADGQHDRLIDYQSRDLADDAVNFDSLLKNRAVGGSVNLSGWAGARHRFRMGLIYRHDFLDKQPDTDAAWERHALGTGSLFLEDRYDVADAVALLGSLQTSWHATDRHDAKRLAASPALSVHWTPRRDTALRAAYGRATRYPTLHALYSQTSGNPDLRPETAAKYEVGLERRFWSGTQRSLSAEVAWFRSDLADLIDRPARSQQFRNVASARLGGLETAVRARLATHLQADVGYMWIDRGATSAEMLRELAPHRFSVGLTADTPFGTRLRYDVTAQDERTTYVPDRRHAAYRLHSVTIRQSLSRGLVLHFEVFNLTDVDFEEELGYPAPGRTIAFGLDWWR